LRPRQGGGKPGARLSRQAPGLGPVLLLPFTTKSRPPSRSSATAFGYQPVGMRPMTRGQGMELAPSPSQRCALGPSLSHFVGEGFICPSPALGRERVADATAAAG